MSIFERYLSVWVGLCNLLGVVLVEVPVMLSLVAIVNRTRW